MSNESSKTKASRSTLNKIFDADKTNNSFTKIFDADKTNNTFTKIFDADKTRKSSFDRIFDY